MERLPELKPGPSGPEPLVLTLPPLPFPGCPWDLRSMTGRQGGAWADWTDEPLAPAATISRFQKLLRTLETGPWVISLDLTPSGT